MSGDDRCVICCDEVLATRASEGQLGTLDCCLHRFCFACIRQWLETTATVCPTCKAPVERLTRRSSTEPLELIELVTADTRQRGYLAPDDMQAEAERLALCVVCGAAHTPTPPAQRTPRDIPGYYSTTRGCSLTSSSRGCARFPCADCVARPDSDADALACDSCDRIHHVACLPLAQQPAARRLFDAAQAAEVEATLRGSGRAVFTPDWFCPDCRPCRALAGPGSGVTAPRTACTDRANVCAHTGAAAGTASPLGFDASAVPAPTGTTTAGGHTTCAPPSRFNDNSGDSEHPIAAFAAGVHEFARGLEKTYTWLRSLSQVESAARDAHKEALMVASAATAEHERAQNEEKAHLASMILADSVSRHRSSDARSAFARHRELRATTERAKARMMRKRAKAEAEMIELASAQGALRKARAGVAGHLNVLRDAMKRAPALQARPPAPPLVPSVPAPAPALERAPARPPALEPAAPLPPAPVPACAATESEAMGRMPPLIVTPHCTSRKRQRRGISLSR